MDREDNEARFALGVLDDQRRLIAAGKTHRWDIVKWAVTVNVALAATSGTLKQQGKNATGLFCLLALGVAIVSVCLMLEITRRMTATRNESRAPEKFLSAQGINVVRVTGKEPSEEYTWTYDKRELGIYVLILLASAAPAFLLWGIGMSEIARVAAASVMTFLRRWTPTKLSCWQQRQARCLRLRSVGSIGDS
jgi:hypothetical protein